MSYSHLTSKERYVIQCCRESGETKSQIAEKLGRSRSTIGRELKRNSDHGSYEYEKAQQQADECAKKSGSANEKLTPDLWKAHSSLFVP